MADSTLRYTSNLLGGGATNHPEQHLYGLGRSGGRGRWSNQPTIQNNISMARAGGATNQPSRTTSLWHGQVEQPTNHPDQHLCGPGRWSNQPTIQNNISVARAGGATNQPSRPTSLWHGQVEQPTNHPEQHLCGTGRWSNQPSRTTSLWHGAGGTTNHPEQHLCGTGRWSNQPTRTTSLWHGQVEQPTIQNNISVAGAGGLGRRGDTASAPRAGSWLVGCLLNVPATCYCISGSAQTSLRAATLR